MKRITKLLTFILLLLFPSIILAYEVEEYERTKDNNYGVNKKWNITNDNKSNVLDTHYVNSEDKIYDFEDVLTDEEEDSLRTLAKEYKEKTGFDIAIVIDDFYFTCYGDDCGTYNEDYAADFYDYNDFGLEDKYYSGVIIVRNQRQVDGLGYLQILYFGEAQFYYGGEEFNYTTRHDAIFLSGSPYFKQEIYYTPFENMINKLSYYYDKGKILALKDYKISPNGFVYNPKDYKLDKNGNLVKIFKPPFVWAFGIGIAVSAITVLIMVKKNKMVFKATTAQEFLDRNTINYTKKSDILVSTHTTHRYISSSSGGGHSGGGGHSSGGSSGGGHSGGGGRC